MSLSFPERLPRDLASAGRSAIQNIDECGENYAEALLSALLRAAWPSLQAQNQ